MNCVSGVASKNLLIQQNEVVLSIEHTRPGSLYVWSYDDGWYFGDASYISVENHDVNIKFLQPNGSAAQYFRPSLETTCWIPIHDIITKVDPPSYGSNGQFYCFDCYEMNCVKKLMWSIWHPFPAESFKKTNKNKSANKYTLLDSSI